MEDLDTLAKITKIYKSGANFYASFIYNGNTSCSKKITLEEASKLEVGQEIKAIYWWNESGNGQGFSIVRPIEVYVPQEPKFRNI